MNQHWMKIKKIKVFLCQIFLSRMLGILKKSKTNKNIWKAELQDSAITAIIILLNLKRK